MAAARSPAPEAEIIGTYSCQGEVNPKVLEKAQNKDDWLEVKNFSFCRQIYQMGAAI
jgi:hypothetical protein